MKTKELLMLKPSQLLTHPRNMRRFYPADQVREIANSIAASKGVLAPLVITKDAKSGKWLVIDGNMRLAGARLLGEKCPALECKVVDQAEAEQRLSMVIANQVRYEVDPVSEGLHYKRLQQDEGLTVREISKRTGVYEARITNRKMLADLEEPIQELIIEGKLPADARVANALLQLTASVRGKLAARLAQNPNTKIATILNACERLGEGKKAVKKLKRPAVELSGVLNAGEGKPGWKGVREAAKKACHGCIQYEGELRQLPEPAWSMIAHSADKVCGACPLAEAQKICGSCPQVELLRQLVQAPGK